MGGGRGGRLLLGRFTEIFQEWDREAAAAVAAAAEEEEEAHS